MTMRRACLLVFSSLFLSSCTGQEPYVPQYNKELLSKIRESKGSYIDFSKLAGSKWTRVCFMGPYNTNVDQALGFKWVNPPVDDIALLKEDGHNLIIFATDFKIISYFVQNRGYGDFWKLSGKCLPRQNSRVVKDDKPGGGFVANQKP